MANQGGYDCDPCDRKYVYKTAIAWCTVCEEGLCADCLDYHSVFKMLKDHNTIDIDIYLEVEPFIKSGYRECDVHNNNWNAYCLEHHEPCCPKCITEDHIECGEKVKSFKEISSLPMEKSTTDKYLACYDIQKNVNQLKSSIKIIQEDLSRHLNEIEIQENNMTNEVDQLLEVLSSELEKFKSRLIKDVSTAISTHNTEVSSITKNLDSSRDRVLTVENNINKIQEASLDIDVEKTIDKFSVDLKEEQNNLDFEKCVLIQRFSFRLLDIQEIKSTIASLLTSRGRVVKVVQNVQEQAACKNPIVAGTNQTILPNSRNYMPTIQLPGQSIIGQGPGQSVLGQAPGQSVLGQAPGQSVLGQAPGPSIIGQGPGQSVLGQAPGQSILRQGPGQSILGQPVFMVQPMQVPTPLLYQNNYHQQLRSSPHMVDTMFKDIPLKEQKRLIGEKLYPKIYLMYPDLAAKITGMLLELDNSNLFGLLESKDSLEVKVKEAVALLEVQKEKEIQRNSESP